MADVWKEVKDEKTGKSYYYNKGTKETSWTKPASMGNTAEGDAENNPAFWNTSEDPKTGKTYYYNKKTKAVLWQKPKCMLEGSEDTKVKKDVWVETKDSKTGKSYWYNKKTKQTTWKNPNKEAAGKPAVAEPKPAEPTGRPAAGSESSEEAAPTSKPAATEQKISAAEGDMAAVKQAQQARDMADIADNSDSDDDGDHEFKFAKHRHGWFNRTFRTGEVYEDAKLLTFKKSMIKKALLKQNRDLDVEAVQAFKNVMSYMGDRKSGKPGLEHAKKLLGNLMIAPAGLRDEVYMQLCKQTTKNPTANSCRKGWEMMVFCMATFPPSKHLKTFLLDFIKKTIEEGQDDSIVKLAQDCEQRMPKIVAMGQRKQVPSTAELECLMEVKPVPIRVSLVNGGHKMLMVNSYDLVEGVEKQLIEKYNLECSEPFAMYEQAEANVERILDPKDRVLDVQASWEAKPLVEEVKTKEAKNVRYRNRDKLDKKVEPAKKAEEKKIEYKSFLYKAKLVLKTTNKEIMKDPEAVNLIYIQATQDVVTNRYPSNDKDMPILAALQLQATFGDFNKDVHVNGWLGPKITEFMPKRLLSKKNKIQQDLVKEHEVKILAKYQKMVGWTSLDAKLNYLEHVQNWTFYGSTFFTVEQRRFKDYPSPLTLGINCEGVLLMHPEDKRVLEQYSYTEIITWGHSDEKFIVVVGNIVQQRKLIFKTTEGAHMNHLIHDYVKFKVKNKA